MEYLDFNEKVFELAKKNNQLIYTTLEITTLCNFKCEHCYLGDKSDGTFLDYDFIIKLLDDLKEKGCLFLLITGGEPLLHPKFKDIYKYAKEKGFIITIFTNGYLINDDIIKLFAQYKPFLVEISLYGIDNESYLNLTKCPNAFEKIEQSIKKLLDNNITTRLKTMLIKQTKDYIKDMYKFADKYNVEFRWDYYIVQAINKNDNNLINSSILTNEEIVDCIMNDEIKLNLFKKNINNHENENDLLYKCGAGLTNVYISSEGEMSICAVAREPKYSLFNGTLDEGFKYIREVGLQKMPENFICKKCSKINVCRYCPSKFKLENDDFYKPIQKYCDIATSVIERIGEMQK